MTQDYTDDELLESLRELADDLGGKPRARDVTEHRSHSARVYRDRFGSWSEAVEKAGLDSLQYPNSKRPYKEKERLRQMYIDEGLSQKEIAEKCDVSESTISNWIQKFDIDRTEKLPWRDEETLRELYWGEQLSIQQVANRLGTDRNVVHEWMKRNGIERREANPSDQEYNNKELLQELYWEKGLSQSEIAEKFGVSQGAITNAMNRLGVETRDFFEAGWEARRVNRCHLKMNSGYVLAGSRCGDETLYIQIHRLVAIAEWGYEAVKDKVVHHRNEVRFDNRPANLELMTDSEHKSHHASNRDQLPPEGF